MSHQDAFVIRWITGAARADYHGNDLELLVEGEDLSGDPVYLSIDAPSIRKLAELLHDTSDVLLSTAIAKERAITVEVRIPEPDTAGLWSASVEEV